MSQLLFRKTLLAFSVLFGVWIFGVLFGLFLSDIGYGPLTENNLAAVSGSHQKEIIVDVRIDYGSEDAQSFPGEVLRQGDTALDLLYEIERKHGVSVEIREFPGLGVFVEAIHGVHNSSNVYWQFWINDAYAKVGAGQYVLQEGDKVLWKRTNEI